MCSALFPPGPSTSPALPPGLLPMPIDLRQFAFTPAAMAAQFMASMARRRRDEVDILP